MKITNTQLKNIIHKELTNVLKEVKNSSKDNERLLYEKITQEILQELYSEYIPGTSAYKARRGVRQAQEEEGPQGMSPYGVSHEELQQMYFPGMKSRAPEQAQRVAHLGKSGLPSERKEFHSLLGPIVLSAIDDSEHNRGISSTIAPSLARDIVDAVYSAIVGESRDVFADMGFPKSKADQLGL